MNTWEFSDKFWFLLLLLLPLIAWLRGRKKTSAHMIPFSAQWYRPTTLSFSYLPQFFAYLGIILLIIALARPQSIEDKKEVRKKGYDIILAIDLSKSMNDPIKSGGFFSISDSLTKLETVKPIISAFINRRKNDRIGVVVFAKQAYTMAPLTFDHQWLKRKTEQLRTGLIDHRKTAIGDGLGIALSRLEQAEKQEKGKRKGAFVILLTDGSNNSGTLPPLKVAEIAQSRSVPVYTIGAATKMEGIQGMLMGQQSGLDEETLREMAQITGGKYFYANDPKTIKSAFNAIDQSQKIEFQAKSYLLTKEHFHWFASPGLLCLFFATFARRWKGGA